MPQSAVKETRTTQRDPKFIRVLFAGFVPTGASTVILAPLLPLLIAKWNLSDQVAGLVISCQFLGSVVGTLGSGVLVRRLGFGRALYGGYLLLSLFAAGVLVLPWLWLALLAAMNGVGVGLIIPATNVAVSESFPERRASALNMVNLAWSVGAIFCPALLAAALRAGKLGTALAVFTGVLVAVAVLIARVQVCADSPCTGDEKSPVPTITFVVLASLFFLYIGSESAVAGWLATYAKRTVISSGVLWMTAPSFFWAAIMTGRAMSPLLLSAMRERALMSVGLLVSGVGIGVILATGTAAGIFLGAAVAGLGMSTVFPIMIAMIPECFRSASGRVSPYLFAMAGLGGAAFPWIVGAVSSRTGRLQIGLMVALTGVLAQLVLTSTLVFLPRTNADQKT